VGGLSGEGAEVQVVSGDAPDADAWVLRVLDGARLIIVGGAGALLDKLHFFRVPNGVSGVGYVIEEHRAVGGPRGKGKVVFVGEESPDAALLERCIGYVVE
jgi:hypothetical protein